VVDVDLVQLAALLRGDDADRVHRGPRRARLEACAAAPRLTLRLQLH
jgi:hypothetical protein